MLRLLPLALPLALPLLLAACASAPERPLHRLHYMEDDRDPRQSALCMAPDGEGLPWRENPTVRDAATGEATFTCPAPAFFVTRAEGSCCARTKATTGSIQKIVIEGFLTPN